MKPIVLLAAAGIALSAGSAMATTSFSFTGTVTDADPGNLFLLGVGNTVTVIGDFHDPIPADGVISFDEMSGNILDIIVGDITFFEFDDEGFDDGFPRLEFESGELVNLNFLGGFDDFILQIFGPGFIASDPSGAEVLGQFDFSTFEVSSTAVPLPAGLPLALTGLAALGLAARRRAA